MSFKSYVAHVVELSAGDDGLPKVERVVVAADCGIAINPDVIKAQLEGGMGYGLSAILYGAIDMEVGFMAHRMGLTEEQGSRPSTEEDAALVNRLSAAATAVTYGLSASPHIGTYTLDTPDQDRGMMAMVSHITVAITGRASDPDEFALQCHLLRDIVGQQVSAGGRGQALYVEEILRCIRNPLQRS